MKKKMLGRVLVVLLSLWSAMSFAQHRNTYYIKYIEQYAPMAQEQMRKYKIPASITLAQGLLESGAGRSTLARMSNNHFGIKCADWKGKSVRHDDDARNECFRAYDSAAESFEDHSKFLVGRSRYASLFTWKITDYKGWAIGLKRAGYATDPSYANRLISIIEDYELYRYDVSKAASKRTEDAPKKYSARQLRRKPWLANPHEIFIANGLAYVVVREGDTFEMLGKELGISSKKLMKYNDLSNTDYPLSEGDILYLKTKNNSASGDHVCHIVREGDSMYGISQRYGIKLKKLYKLNAKEYDYIPEVGDRIWLK